MRTIREDLAAHDWFPARAFFVGYNDGQPYYREVPSPDVVMIPVREEIPAPPPPWDMGDCIGLPELQAHPEDYPWYPSEAAYCGELDGVDYFRPLVEEPPPPPPPGDDQPPGDVDDDEAPDAYLPEAQDDYTPFDPE